jgi:hypothetical protein
MQVWILFYPMQVWILFERPLIEHRMSHISRNALLPITSSSAPICEKAHAGLVPVKWVSLARRLNLIG